MLAGKGDAAHSVHPAWSCSQLGRGDGAGAIKAGGGSVPLYAAGSTHMLLLSGASSWNHLGSENSEEE